MGQFEGWGVLKMQQLALRKAQNFILRVGNSGRGHCVDKIRRAASNRDEAYLYHRQCFHPVFLENVIVEYCKTYLVLIFQDRSIIVMKTRILILALLRSHCAA